MAEFPPPVDVVSVRVVEGHVVELGFDDGETRTRDLAPLLTGPVFDAIRSDPALFAEVAVDPDRGTIMWPNGADIDAELLRYDDLWAQGPARAARRDRADELAERLRIEELLADSLTPAGVAQWLSAPNRLLGGRCPSELLEEGRGDDVLYAAEAFVAGDYV